ncbi:MAG: aminotransferase class V-fold PLP-dependent enzyme [Clostridia bacterium]|nr:aminotransferase class V-fold PLP-dependent enzyme [Clostridia bacterium]MBR7033671.1 aminotransferase class V-fold PLP-dependent enzyme [Clostridia bacterium]
MISFRSDYSQGAHPKVLEALISTNEEHTDGYGLDVHCERAAELVRDLIGVPDAHVHMTVGGTPCNVTFIAACLRPYESVIAARTGHAYFHETGAVEATGHRIVTVDGEDGKLTPALIDRAFEEYQDEHTPLPRLVCVSQPTELGTIYSKAELNALFKKCRELDLILYVDGARLGSALTCSANDLSIKELARLCDAFYIGGTKNGALFGEALVILRDELNDHFRWMIKRQCGLLAKGRLIGVQFEALLDGGENSIYYKIAARENVTAEIIRSGLSALGIRFYGNSPTNQVFPILPVSVVRKLEDDFFFYEWAPERDGVIPIRLVTGWGTTTEEAEAFVSAVGSLL